MRKKPGFIGVTVSTFLLVAGVAQGCGSSSDEIPTDVPATRPSTEVESGAPPPQQGDGGSGQDGASLDSGPEASSGGSNPLKVSCGATECSGSFCCVAGDAGASSCMTEESQCVAASSARLNCDEKADCPGKDCCLTLSTLLPGPAESKCKDSCGATELQLCKLDSECETGKKCAVVTCAGRVYRSCNKPFGCQ